jgi:HAD superfamily hydrolase (TIGR01509 family)
MKLYDAFIFDIDGTLTSTNELIFATFNHVTEKYLNKSYSPNEIISFFGPTEDVILKNWMGNRYDDARRDYYKFYADNHDAMAHIFPGILDIVGMIKKEGLPLAIFTGKGRKSSEITLSKIGLLDYFDMIISGDDVVNHKPDPEGINKFLSGFKLNPDRVLMIGDAPADVIAARHAGIKCASVLWDSYAKEEVLKLKSDYVFHSIEELREFLDELI